MSRIKNRVSTGYFIMVLFLFLASSSLYSFENHCFNDFIAPVSQKISINDFISLISSFHKNNPGDLVILVSSPTSAGKSFFSEKIRKESGSFVLEMDAFYKNAHQCPLVEFLGETIYDWDNPEALRSDELVNAVKKILNHQPFEYKTLRENSEVRINMKDNDILLVEGLFSYLFKDIVKDLKVFSVFLEVPWKERYLRRILRAYKELGEGASEHEKISKVFRQFKTLVFIHYSGREEAIINAAKTDSFIINNSNPDFIKANVSKIQFIFRNLRERLIVDKSLTSLFKKSFAALLDELESGLYQQSHLHSLHVSC